MALSRETLKVETIRLRVHQYTTELLLDEGILGDVRTEIDYVIHRQAYSLRTALRVLGEEPSERLLAQYPASLTDHALDVLVKRLPSWCSKYLPRPRFKYVYQIETIVYPSLPANKASPRVFIEHRYAADPVWSADNNSDA